MCVLAFVQGKSYVCVCVCDAFHFFFIILYYIRGRVAMLKRQWGISLSLNGRLERLSHDIYSLFRSSE